MTGKIAYQGEPGANSHIACNEAYPALEPMPCRTFEDCFAAVERGDADLAMIPVENTIAGRVGDIHYLLPNTELQIVAEYYLPIRFQLMALAGTRLADIRKARSHIMGLGQCRNFLRTHGIDSVTAADTAGAAREVAELGDPSVAAIAPRLAAEVYGLEILAEDIEDAAHNTTRFIIMSKDHSDVEAKDGPAKTAFMFEVGGFGTNGINMTKLESYMVGGSFTATLFYAEIDGHPDERHVQLALEELGFFSQSLKILGVFPSTEHAPD